MGAPAQEGKATKQWTSLITTSLRRRIRADQLSDALQELSASAPIPGATLVSLILTSGARVSNGVDPLIPAYLDEVLKTTGVDVCDVLVALLAHSRYAVQGLADHDESTSLHDLLLQESIFTLLSRLVLSGKRPRTAQESRRAVRALAEWITSCNYHETMLQVQAEGLRTPGPAIITALETLGTFTVALFTNGITRKDMTETRSPGEQR